MGYGGVINKVVDPFGWGSSDAVGTPNASKVGRDYAGLLSAWQQGMPQVLSTATQYSPQFTDLALANNNRWWQGSDGTPGAAQLFSDTIVPLMNDANSQTRASNLADLTALGPEAAAAMMNADPSNRALLDLLTSQATSELGLGSSLDPSQMRLVEQSVRSGQAARGMGYGPADAYGETLGVSAFGNALKQQRVGNANSVVSLRNSITSPGLAAIMNSEGQVNQALGASGAGGAAASTAAGSAVAPANDMFGMIYNASAGAKIATGNNQAAENNSY